VQPLRKPTWQQATALVSLSTCGAMTGLSFSHGTVAQMTSPASMPVHLVDFSTPAHPAASSVSEEDGTLRSAIVNVANYYLRMAQSKTPAEMEALIWQSDSVDGVDHGESCAAFASLTLELGAQAAGQESWVSGGTTYPWPLHSWADVRVDENPSSPGVISVQQDAESHHRWHPLGDGYQPQPGDWVLFDEHVEVVTKFANGVLSTIGGDSLPGFTVNAHQFSGSLGADGVVGFVNNGELLSTASSDTQQAAAAQNRPAAQELPGSVGSQAQGHAGQGQAAIPGTLVAALSPASGSQTAGTAGQLVTSAPARRPPAAASAQLGKASIPGLQVIQADTPPVSSAATASSSASAPSSASSPSSAPSGSRSRETSPTAGVPGTAAQQAFISQVAPGAMASQRRFGVPAAVTIAQAIEESGWGQSTLATRDHNLFGIKGSGPAGSDIQPTQEYENGRWVTVSAPFRVYHNVAESIADHAQLLATGESYQQAMADRHLPDAFATDLTGVYATDPDYGSNLIALMKLYNLYRYDAGSAESGRTGTGQSGTASSTAAGQRAATANEAAANQATVTGGSTAGTASGPGNSGTGSDGTESAAAGSSGTGSSGTGNQGGASIPGVLDAFITSTAKARSARPAANASVRRAQPPRPRTTAGRPSAPRSAGHARSTHSRYVSQIPLAVTTDFIATAKAPLTRAEPLYTDVASRAGIRWELLAACDWMQCKAQPRLSPVHGEKLGTRNSDGTVYRTKSEALAQCANDLVELAMAVYWIDITARRPLSVRKLASIFAAFRWGGLLKLHNISAMEFPYSVAGLTEQNLKMRWPDLREPNAPDKPGSRFRAPFGAVPAVLSLDYPATDE
jgi:flagellum-specific peptidoglycan hydrolase FlgJ